MVASLKNRHVTWISKICTPRMCKILLKRAAIEKLVDIWTVLLGLLLIFTRFTSYNNDNSYKTQIIIKFTRRNSFLYSKNRHEMT